MPATLNRNQQRVYEWLNNDLALPVFAEAYKGAVILLRQRPPGYVSFVAHVGRDLMNRLAPTVAGIKSGRVQYQQHLDKLQAVWSDELRSGAEPFSGVTETGQLIPANVCQQISALIDEHKSGRIRNSQADGLFFSTFLDYSDKDKIPGNFLSEWKVAKGWFLEHAHLRKDPFKLEAVEDMVRHFNCLDGYLYIAASSQYERLKTLNDILEKTNQ